MHFCCYKENGVIPALHLTLDFVAILFTSWWKKIEGSLQSAAPRLPREQRVSPGMFATSANEPNKCYIWKCLLHLQLLHLQMKPTFAKSTNATSANVWYICKCLLNLQMKPTTSPADSILNFLGPGTIFGFQFYSLAQSYFNLGVQQIIVKTPFEGILSVFWSRN